MKRLFILLFFGCMISSSGFAQTASIGDIYYFVQPKFILSQDSLTEVYTDSTTIIFQVEINSVSNTDEVYISVGSTDGSSNALSITLDVVNNSGTYYLEYGTFSFEVDNGYVIIEVESSEQNVDNMRFAEIWLKDNQQNISAKSKTTFP